MTAPTHALIRAVDYGDAVARVRNWSFEWHEDDAIENPYATVDLDGLEPGQYYLHFVQESGWGFFEYTVSHGGGVVGLLVAPAKGFLLAASLLRWSAQREPASPT